MIAPQSPTGRLQNGNAPLALGVGSREPALYRLAAMAKCGSSGRLHSDATCARTPSCTFGRAIATSNSCLCCRFEASSHIDGTVARNAISQLHGYSCIRVRVQMWKGWAHSRCRCGKDVATP